MEKIVKNTERDFELMNGQVVKLTLTFGKLAKLKSVNKPLYDRFNDVMNGKNTDILEMAVCLYVTYWCANYDNDTLYTEQQFIDLVPFDAKEIASVFNELTRPKKK